MNTDTINPMDWHNTKLLNYIPEHFVRVKFRHNDKRGEVLDWIEANTTGRFAIEEIVDIEAKHSFLVNIEYQVGFENPADATMYTMFYR